MSPTAVRTHQGQVIPAPGTYQIDPAHSSVEFVARHMMIAKVRGRFGTFSGSIVVAEDPADSKVDVEIDAASIGTNEETRDGHLRSADFLDVATHPRLSFVSTAVRPASGEHWLVDGDLTIRGVSRPVTLDVELEGGGPSPFGDHRFGFSATTEIDREDFGLTYNQALETGGVLVGKTVKIELSVEAVLQA